MNHPVKDFSLKDLAGPDVVRSAGTDCVRLVAAGSVRFAATDFSSTGQGYSIADAGNPFPIRFPLIAPIFVVLQSQHRIADLCGVQKLSCKKWVVGSLPVVASKVLQLAGALRV